MPDITSDLIFYLKLDETSGTTAADETANNYDGTLNNGPSWAAGQIDGGLSFDGSDDYVSVSAEAIDDRSFTIALWFYQEPGGAFEQVMVSIGTASATNQAMAVKMFDGGWLHFGFYANDLDTGFGYYDRETFHHLVCRYNYSTGERSIWLDGVKVAEQSSGVAAFEDTSTAWNIGRKTLDGGSNYFGGTLDEVRVYGRALADEDIEELYAYTGEPSVVDGDADFTEPNETVAATGAVAVVGVGAFTEPTDTLTGTGSVAVVGSASFTEPNEALSSDVGVRWYADAAFTEPNETLAAEAAVAVVGALNAIDPAAEALSSAVAVAVVGAADFTEPNETVAAEAEVEGAIVADLVGVEPNETLEGAAAVAISAALAGTEANEALNGVAAVAVVGSAEFTEPNETVSSTGTGANVAAAEFTEANETLEGAAAVAVVGSAAFTEPGETVASDAAVRVFADLIGTEANDNLSSTAAVAIVASAAFTEPNEQLGSLVDTGTGFVYGTHRRISIGVGIGV